MSKNFVKLVFSLFLLFGISGCSTKKDNDFVQSIFQTNGAVAVRQHTDFLIDSLLLYYIKLNKRNPSFTSKNNFNAIAIEMKNRSDRINLPLVTQKASYKEYLNIAFDKEYVKDRNDYLILGIYKMFYYAYDVQRTHTVTTIQYDTQKIQEANTMMQIIQYKIQTARNKDGNYLFLTWQRGWQVDVLKKKSQNKTIELEKYTKEELLYSSNMSYQVLSSKMIFTLQESLKYLGVEATNLSAQAIKSVFMFL